MRESVSFETEVNTIRFYLVCVLLQERWKATGSFDTLCSGSRLTEIFWWTPCNVLPSKHASCGCSSRPKTIEDIAHQDEVVNTLQNAIKDGNVSKFSCGSWEMASVGQPHAWTHRMHTAEMPVFKLCWFVCRICSIEGTLSHFNIITARCDVLLRLVKMSCGLSSFGPRQKVGIRE